MVDAPDANAQPQWLCTGAELTERGAAKVFDVLEHGRPQRAFALRIDGRVVAYLNRCVHVPVEMDWQPGQFLDSRREFIVCSIHGASYDPRSGHCAGGPCHRGRLTPVSVSEQGAEVHWYPSRDIRPAPAAPPMSAPLALPSAPDAPPSNSKTIP